jgi:hypothetical protein
VGNKIPTQNIGRKNSGKSKGNITAGMYESRNNGSTRERRKRPCAYAGVMSADISPKQNHAVTERSKFEDAAEGIYRESAGQ